jgi:hypothetical protein
MARPTRTPVAEAAPSSCAAGPPLQHTAGQSALVSGTPAAQQGSMQALVARRSCRGCVWLAPHMFRWGCHLGHSAPVARVQGKSTTLGSLA